jgi:predicted nucleotidyltransferase
MPLHDDVVAQVREAVAGVEGVVAVYLFGSVAAGTDTASSDVDLGVLYRTPPEPTLDAGPRDLEAELERRLRRPVQLVVLNGARPDVRIRVLRAQRLILERDRAARIRFEVATRNEFFDLEPVLRVYRTPREARSTDPALVAKKLAAIESGLADLRRLARPADLDTVLVHGYDDVNLDIVRDILDRRLADLQRFVAAVRGRL